MPSHDLIYYKNLFDYLSQITDLDEQDWQLACQYAEHWKVSMGDACTDLKFVNEGVLAKAFSVIMELPYIPEQEIVPDFSGIDHEIFVDLVNSGAVPLNDGRLAICNPYDDHRAFLSKTFCEMEMVITERRAIFKALRSRN